MEVLIVLPRWLHIISAALVIGGAFFARVILPIGLAQADAASRRAVALRCRRIFKMLIHTCILLLLLSGAFNTWRAWGDYRLNPPLMHGLWGTHLLLGLAAMTIALILLSPKEPPAWAKSGAAVNLLILFITVAVAGTLKFVHDRAARSPAPAAVSNTK